MVVFQQGSDIVSMVLDATAIGPYANGDQGPIRPARPVESGETSLVAHQTRSHHGPMSMYVGFLSDALRAWPTELTGEALVDHAVDARVAMLSARHDRNPSAYDLLAADLAYDLSLVLLCDDLGVAIRVVDFADPLTERARIECALLETWGLDLCALSRARCRTSGADDSGSSA